MSAETEAPTVPAAEVSAGLAKWRAAHPLPKHPGCRDPSLDCGASALLVERFVAALTLLRDVEDEAEEAAERLESTGSMDEKMVARQMALWVGQAVMSMEEAIGAPSEPREKPARVVAEEAARAKSKTALVEEAADVALAALAAETTTAPAYLSDAEAVTKAVALGDRAMFERLGVVVAFDDDAKVYVCGHSEMGWKKYGSSDADALASLLREVRAEPEREQEQRVLRARFLDALGVAPEPDVSAAARIEELEQRLASAHEELSQFRKTQALDDAARKANAARALELEAQSRIELGPQVMVADEAARESCPACGGIGVFRLSGTCTACGGRGEVFMDAPASEPAASSGAVCRCNHLDHAHDAAGLCSAVGCECDEFRAVEKGGEG